jgi:hypothetical protein
MTPKITTSTSAIFLIISLIVALNTTVFAQQPSPSPPPDYSPDKWSEYSSPLGEYRIRFPGRPSDVSTNNGKVETRGMEYKGVLTYRVIYVDYGESIDDPAKVKDLLQGIKEAALNAVRDRGLLVVADNEVEVDGHPGVFVHVEVQRRSVVRMQWVISGSRLYTISTLSDKTTSKDPEAKDDYESTSATFIKSFHITS